VDTLPTRLGKRLLQRAELERWVTTPTTRPGSAKRPKGGLYDAPGSTNRGGMVGQKAQLGVVDVPGRLDLRTATDEHLSAPLVAARSVMGRAVPRLVSPSCRKWFGLRRQWYVYIAGALLYTSAVALGNFWLFLVGTAIIFIAVGIGEVDRKAERRAVATAPLAVGDGCTVSWRPSVRRGGPARGAEDGSAVRPHPVACPMAVGRKHGLDGMLRVRGQDGYRRAATSWRIRRSHPGRDRHRSSSRHPSRQGVCHSHANCPRLSAFRWPTCSGLLHPPGH
jgi:hypothetical protein